MGKFNRSGTKASGTLGMFGWENCEQVAGHKSRLNRRVLTGGAGWPLGAEPSCSPRGSQSPSPGTSCAGHGLAWTATEASPWALGVRTSAEPGRTLSRTTGNASILC